MNGNNPAGTPPLREALYALSMAKRVPDAEVLDDVVRQYPQFAEELTDFAVELVIDLLRGTAVEDVESDSEAEHLSPDVSRAISTFHNHVYALKEGAEEARGERNAPSTGGGNPFARLNRADIRAVAKRMDASGAFVAKLRDGQILSGTMTDGFMGHVVAVMDDVAGVPEELVYAHLAGEAQTAAASRQFYKAASGPEVSKQQTFEEAVRSSGLSAVQQRRLLSL